ncbi:thioredoxin domain-containing protein [Novipirellula artificiosorum]|uniref:Spermatogenesis-associated protein 20-like TRX domain-containing protein n=1 Tax=Novipirellula artificiosorum TaxID=2528016 RepID=A0A5C6DW68_9BACT|nr:thioredoxin domain-containing protein [Novipirellula artificiosorum]TWU40980.1 hypothetical protein Poly41_18150 [Novipirellula artificiosorum]
MNLLSNSLSPYLLQHKDNPVDWYPWGEEAFEKARETDRPIFLSVGYAACHWCHVMEHESFEDESIARFLNENFVSIKVDREERPDIDQIYMNAVQLMTGRGGWPMSVFLDHDRKPFYAGTYWPATPRGGMPGFTNVLDALADAWKNRREEVEDHAGKITDSLHQLASGTAEPASSVPGDSIVQQATSRLLQVLDRKDGGFGSAPKFPHATDLNLLLRRSLTTEDNELADAAELTLDRMADGGIRDHIGGGFARYSVDGKWLVPHFEKMLYDNALLAQVYVRAFQVTGNQRHAAVAREVLDYLDREMIDPSGGFHCSEDADSEGVEGKYYVWTPAEVKQILGDDEGARFCQVYDITEAGNFEGNSIANLPRSIESWAVQWSMPDLAEQLAGQREKLRVIRDSRIHPGRDDKILTAWNSLAISAFAVAGGVLDCPRYIEIARRAMKFTLGNMMTDDGRLKHAFRQGQSHLAGYVDDYAFTIEALLSLFEVTGQARCVARAVKLAERMIEHFEDKDAGGFFYTADDSETLITRTKDWHDGSLVSGNASAVMSLLKLSRLGDRDDFRDAAERTLRMASDILESQSAACAGLVAALDHFHNDSEQLVLAVSDKETMQSMRSLLLSRFRPHTTLSWVIGEPPPSGPMVALNQSRYAIDGEPTLYRCEDFSCDAPMKSIEVTSWLRRDAR